MNVKDILALLLSLCAVLVAAYAIYHKDNREDTSEDKDAAVKFAEQKVLLKQVLDNTLEIKLEQKSMATKFDGLTERVVIVEQSAKSAHKRIDGIEGREKHEKN